MTDFNPLPPYRYLGMKLPKSRQFERNLEGYESWAGFLNTYGSIDFSFSKGNLMTNCPFHEDKKPSFGLIDTPAKKTYHCFSCGKSGSLKQLVTELTGDPIAWKELRNTLKPTSDYERSVLAINASINFDYEKIMIASYMPCAYWQSRGLTEETIKRYELGAREYQVAFLVWDVVSQCYTGICYREMDTRPDYPESRKEGLLTGEILKYRFGSGVKRNQSVFGANFLDGSDEVYVFESAIDCMNHWQRTDKPSVATWGKDISQAQLDYLTGFKQVVLCPDKDANRAGLKSAEQAEYVLKDKTEVKIQLLDGPYKDYTEAVMAGVELPQFHILTASWRGRHQQIEAVYKTSERKFND